MSNHRIANFLKQIRNTLRANWKQIFRSSLLLFLGFLCGFLLFGQKEALRTASGFNPEISQNNTLQIPEITCTLLQLGAFKEEENAQNAAHMYQNRGAAGYIYQEDIYKVLASAYEKEEDAKIVKAQLLEKQGIESCLSSYHVPAFTINSTGTKAEIASFENALKVWKETLDTFALLSQKQEQPSMEEASLAFENALQNLTKASASLPKEKEEANLLSFKTLLTNCENVCKLYHENPSLLSNGSYIKFAYLSFLFAYKEFHDDLL